MSGEHNGVSAAAASTRASKSPPVTARRTRRDETPPPPQPRAKTTTASASKMTVSEAVRRSRVLRERAVMLQFLAQELRNNFVGEGYPPKLLIDIPGEGAAEVDVEVFLQLRMELQKAADKAEGAARKLSDAETTGEPEGAAGFAGLDGVAYKFPPLPVQPRVTGSGQCVPNPEYERQDRRATG